MNTRFANPRRLTDKQLDRLITRIDKRLIAQLESTHQQINALADIINAVGHLRQQRDEYRELADEMANER